MPGSRRPASRLLVGTLQNTNTKINNKDYSKREIGSSLPLVREECWVGIAQVFLGWSLARSVLDKKTLVTPFSSKIQFCYQYLWAVGCGPPFFRLKNSINFY